jgi:hypothetical protein
MSSWRESLQSTVCNMTFLGCGAEDGIQGLAYATLAGTPPLSQIIPMRPFWFGQNWDLMLTRQASTT